jgi:hypothetical protein
MLMSSGIHWRSFLKLSRSHTRFVFVLIYVFDAVDGGGGDDVDDIYVNRPLQ